MLEATAKVCDVNESGRAEAIGEVLWGMQFCRSCTTKQDLLSVLLQSNDDDIVTTDIA